MSVNIRSDAMFQKIGSIFLLGLSVFFSAFGVVYNQHINRQLFIQLQNQQQDIESLQVEWGQLLLEQGTLASDSRVERIAFERLTMTLPEPHEVIIVKDE